MTLLSAFVGHFLPNIISREIAGTLTSILFVAFGTNLLRDAFKMSGNEMEEEMEQVSLEVEAGMEGRMYKRKKNYWRTVWIQAFILTFAAEWGDRSQIATVALAGAQVYLYHGRTFGGLLLVG